MSQIIHTYRKKGIKDHLMNALLSLRRSHMIYKRRKERWSVGPQTFIWRTRYEGIRLFAEMFEWISQPVPLGETIQEWSNEQKGAGQPISRACLALSVTQEKFSTAEVIVALKERDLAESTIKKGLSNGVKHGLLRQPKKGWYQPTDLFIAEAFERTLYRLLDPNVVEFCKYVLMVNSMREVAESIAEREASGELGSRDFHWFLEALYKGDYDDELDGFFDEDWRQRLNAAASDIKTSSDE